MPGRSVQADEPCEDLDDPTGADAARDVDGERLARPLVDDRQAFELLNARVMSIIPWSMSLQRSTRSSASRVYV
jgi:hypothetical protein